MLTLDAGHSVAVLRFSPDSQHLFSGSGYQFPDTHRAPIRSTVDVWSVADGSRRTVALPPDTSWGNPNELALHPDGTTAWLALEGTSFAFDPMTGKSRPAKNMPSGFRVVVSPDGSMLVSLVATPGQAAFGYHLAGRPVNGPGWETPPLEAQFAELGGFLSDNDRFVTVYDRRVRFHSFAENGRQVAEAKYASDYFHQPQISPDGRHLAVIGTTCIYLYDLATLGPPRRVAPASINGGFRSFAFHPNGRTMAIIHKGPSLVKLYDLDTLKLVTKFQWKVGAHNAVAFSPDGTLAAAGGESGKIVVWDVDA